MHIIVIFQQLFEIVIKHKNKNENNLKYLLNIINSSYLFLIYFLSIQFGAIRILFKNLLF